MLSSYQLVAPSLYIFNNLLFICRYYSLDSHTIRLLSNRTRTPHFFAPLGNGHFFENHGVPKKNIHIMDWWDTKRLEVPVPHVNILPAAVLSTTANHCGPVGSLKKSDHLRIPNRLKMYR